MRHLWQAFVMLLAGSTDRQLALQVRYLRAENRILRSKLPRRVKLTDRERRTLVKLGRAVGAGLKHLVSVVSYSTFRRWLRDDAGEGKPKTAAATRRKPGRPKKPDDLRELIVRLGKETGWGYTRILGEVRKLTTVKVSRQFVVNVLKEHGLDPTPRKERSWGDFVKAHAATLWQCDFFGVRVLTARGWKDAFVLAWIHVATRKVFTSEATYNPNAAWVEDQGRAFVRHVREGRGPACATVMRDNDAKYTAAFDAGLTAAGVEVRPTPYRSPNLNAYIERWVQSIKFECLDAFVPLGLASLDLLVGEYVAHYHAERPHQSLDNKPIGGATATAEGVPQYAAVTCKTRLGGVLRHYHRAAA